jgi:hypothetical protein
MEGKKKIGEQFSCIDIPREQQRARGYIRFHPFRRDGTVDLGSSLFLRAPCPLPGEVRTVIAALSYSSINSLSNGFNKNSNSTRILRHTEDIQQWKKIYIKSPERKN